jgi:hypothetical protein
MSHICDGVRRAATYTEALGTGDEFSKIVASALRWMRMCSFLVQSIECSWRLSCSFLKSSVSNSIPIR